MANALLKHQEKAMEALERRVAELVEKARAIVVTNEEEDKFAGLALQQLKGAMDEVGGLWDSTVSKAYDAYQEGFQARKKLLDPLKAAERIIKDTVGAFRLAERQKREAAETERRKLLEETSRKEAQAVERASALEASGKGEEAAKVIDAAAARTSEVLAAAPIFAKPATKGIGETLRYEFEVTDTSLVPGRFKIIDLVAIGKVVDALGEAHGIPGIRVWPKVNISVRRR